MSRMNPQEYQILQDNKFNLYCSVLGVKEQCTFAPDKKVIERAFRKSALKCHPDKGGDPVVFKKLNEAYNKLIGHIGKLEQQTEAIELANSILIEVSKTSVVKWHEKLKTRYGWFKTDNCKNIIFDGPFKQYMGRSKNTGNITVVLYEDPPDTIPKIHVRSSKYMAWIAEQQMPVHMHVEKGKNIQFDQWRIAHLAEFGICNFASAAPPTPTPEKKEPPKPKAKTPKAKRREAREASERRSKTRRDSEPSPEPTEKNTEGENNKENTEPKVSEGFSDMNGNDMKKDEFNQENPPVPEFPFNCGHCGEGFNNLMDYALHKKLCVPDEEFGFSSGMQDAINNQNKEKKVGFEEKMDKSDSSDSSAQTIKTPASTEANEQKKQTTPKFQCEKCAERFTNMVWYAKHKNACKVGESTEPEPTSEKEPVPVTNGKHESKSSNNIPSNEPQKQSSPPKHSNNSSMTNGSNVEKDINGSKENVLPMPKTSKNIKIDVDEKEEDISPNKNDQATKTAQNVKKDNDNIQNTSKENVCPTQEKIKNDINGFRKTSKEQASTTSKEMKNDNHISQTETKENITLTPMEKKYGKHGEKVSNENCAPSKVDDIKMDTDNQYHNDKNVEEKTQKKNVQITKTGKVTKPAKAQKLSKDLADVDLKNKPEATCTVEDMDVDDPEISKVDTLKPTQKKNDMPMGSLLTNLPTTAKPPPESDLNSKSPPKMAPAQAKRCSMVYVVGPNTFAGNPMNVRTIKHSASAPSANLQSSRVQKVK